MKRSPGVIESNFDIVGKYNQDRINGFSESTIATMLKLARIEEAEQVLDCMAGDGNLTERLYSFCSAQNIKAPKTTILEYSRVQSEFARKRLSAFNTEVIWGDVLSFQFRETGAPLPEAAYDRVLIKSANHEIPRHMQQQFADNLNQFLKPGGLLINLGFLLEDPIERDEFATFTKVKDGLAGMHMLVENRYFLLKDEYYGFLEQAGFEVIQSEAIEYTIDSRIIAEQYFQKEYCEEYHLAFQAAQLEAIRMRKKGSITFSGHGTVMKIPGEITVAKRVPSKKKVSRIYAEYPYELVKSMRCHRDLRRVLCSLIPDESRVLDLGCGPGFLGHDLRNKTIQYTGIDSNETFISYARKHAGETEIYQVGDINSPMKVTNQKDYVVLLNVLYQDSLDVHRVLNNAYTQLRSGGRVCIAGPLRKDSFKAIEKQIYADLIEDGIEFEEDAFRAIVRSNTRLLNAAGNYWSVEGIVALLAAFNFKKIISADSSHYYGESYLVIAEK